MIPFPSFSPCPLIGDRSVDEVRHGWFEKHRDTIELNANTSRAATAAKTLSTTSGAIATPGFGEWNLDVHYALSESWSLALGIYNLLNTHAAAAEFFYVDRLQNEIGSYPDGRADVHEHPLEPISARFTVSKRF